MPYKMLKGFSPWEIIIKNLETDHEISLSNKYRSLCPFCYYPIRKDSIKQCHIGIEHHTSKVSFITGHFYETDYKGTPLNWYSKLIKDISNFPFRFSHELLSLVLVEKILNSNWILDEIAFSTMVPTTNQQMESLFSKISEKLKLFWIPSDQFFIRKELTRSYKDRKSYVYNKYFLEENKISNYKNLDKNRPILIFDDIFHQGYTFGRIVELLNNLSFKKFNLVTIARTVPKSFLKTFSFP